MSKITDSIIKQQENNTKSLLSMQDELSRLSEEWQKDEPFEEPSEEDKKFFDSLELF